MQVRRHFKAVIGLAGAKNRGDDVAETRWSTVRHLLASVMMSPAVTDVLSTMAPSTQFPRPTADVPAYLRRALAIGRKTRETANQFLYAQVRKAAGQTRLSEIMELADASGARRELALSPGLQAVFADAVQIRMLTGGADEYIGARHVIVAILTGREKALVRERDRFLGTLGYDARESAQALGVLLRHGMEDGESAAAWSQLLLSRRFEAAAREVLQPPGGMLGGVTLDAHIMAGAPDESSGPAIIPAASGGAQVPALAPQFHPISGFLNDNPWSVPLADIVGTDGVAHALARLIAARDFQPPLAVGVFGAWGSGKSLLMRRLHSEVERLEAGKAREFHEGIVQISFNAWHYVDTDLWASLAGSIFEELDAHSRKGAATGPGLLGQLTTARRLTLEAARGVVSTRQVTRRAEAAVQLAEEKMAAQRVAYAMSLKGLKAAAHAATAAGKTWLDGDKEARAAIQATYGRSLEEMAAIWATPEEAIESLRKDRLVWLETIRLFGQGKTLVFAGFFGLGLLLIPWLAPLLAGLAPRLSSYLADLQPAGMAVTGLLSAFAIASSSFARKAMAARDAIVSAMEVYQEARTKAAKDGKGALQRAHADLQVAQDGLERARMSLDAALSRQADADVAFAAETPASRLRSFVEARAAADGPYRTRQGLISTIRRDFRDLAALMNPAADELETQKRAQADETWKADIAQLNVDSAGDLTADELKELEDAAGKPQVERPFRRIVLYIDDLDRCPPAKVLEVLQAAHLLLAHSLFVVVVAVDVRWLTGALQTEYPDLIHSKVGGGGDTDRAVALDYLEKIFQLPVWTEAVPVNQAASIIQASLSIREVAQQPFLTAAEPPTSVLEAPLEETLPEHAATSEVVAESQAGTKDGTHETLRLEPFEVEYLGRLAEKLCCSPRRLLRLANTYRVARASVSAETGVMLLHGGYKGFGALLGLAASHPNEFRELTTHLAVSDQWGVVLKEWGETCPELGDRLAILVSFLEIEGVRIVEDVRPLIPLARRFSFTG